MPDISENERQNANEIIDKIDIKKLLSIFEDDHDLAWWLDGITDETEKRESIKDYLYEDYAFVKPLIDDLIKI